MDITNKSFDIGILKNKYMFNYSFSHVHTRVFYTILKLNICDLIESGPKSVDELSKLTNISRESILRLCRFFAVDGFFIQEENSSGEINNNPIIKKTENSSLFTEHGGLKYYGLLISHNVVYKANYDLYDYLVSGKSSFEKIFNRNNIWDVLAKDQEFAEIFNKAMLEISSVQCKSYSNSIDWSPFKQIIDIGGNHGKFLMDIINVNPNCKGINFDLESVVNSQFVVKHPSITHVAGNFFESIPTGDCYVLKHIFHDWDDEKCIQILKSIHNSIKDDGKVLIFDLLVDPKGNDKIPLIFDMFIWCAWGGKERELYQFKTIADKAGFKIENYKDCGLDHCITLIKK